MNTENQELLPCPFCGGQPTLIDRAGWELDCCAGAQNWCFATPEKDRLIDAWNSRAPQVPDPHSAPIPQNIEQAVLMANLGLGWLQQHAPDRLTATQVAAAPEGWALVPVKPTDAMLASLDHPDAAMARIYRAMLATAPAPDEKLPGVFDSAEALFMAMGVSDKQATHILMPRALTPALKDAIAPKWCYMPDSMWADMIAAQERVPLAVMTNEDGDCMREWYFDCDGHYIDVKEEQPGKFSVYFRDKKTNGEGWLDQTDPIAAERAAGEAP